MIVVRISSGLGNQLFQFAAGRALSYATGADLCADPISYSAALVSGTGRAARRDFLLASLGFQVKCRPIGEGGLYRLRGYPRVRNLLLDGNREAYYCSGSFSQDFATLGGNALLQGYFQDQRYWMTFGDDILSEVSSTLSRAAADNEISVAVDSEGAAAMHVRRGDYLDHPEFFPKWFEGYYERVLKVLLAEAEPVDIFCDDPGWCASAFASYASRIRIRKPSTELGGIADLLAMAAAKRLAIANSTFSWWAARIGSASGQRVYAPSRWLETTRDLDASLYQPNWCVIE